MTAVDSTIPASRSFVGSNMVGALAVLAFAVIVPPLLGSDYWYNALLAPFLALALAALGLQVLTGYAGQVSLASSAFMAIGAFTAYNLNLRTGLPDAISILLAGILAAAIGIIFSLPALRLRGFYLALSTLGTQFFVEWATNNYQWLSNYSQSGIQDVAPLRILGYSFATAEEKYFLALGVVAIITFLVARLVKTQTGLNFIAIRDNEVAARIIGVPVLRTKLIAFAVSSFIIGIAGVLWAFTYLGMVQAGYGGFSLGRSLMVLFIIIIGGLATIRGAFLGAAFMVILPPLLSRSGLAVFGSDLFDATILENCISIVVGSLIIILLIYEPDGLSALLDRITRSIKGMFSGRKEAEHAR